MCFRALTQQCGQSFGRVGSRPPRSSLMYSAAHRVALNVGRRNFYPAADIGAVKARVLVSQLPARAWAQRWRAHRTMVTETKPELNHSVVIGVSTPAWSRRRSLRACPMEQAA